MSRDRNPRRTIEALGWTIEAVEVVDLSTDDPDVVTFRATNAHGSAVSAPTLATLAEAVKLRTTGGAARSEDRPATVPGGLGTPSAASPTPDGLIARPAAGPPACVHDWLPHVGTCRNCKAVRACSQCHETEKIRHMRADADTCSHVCKLRKHRRAHGVKPSKKHQRDALERYYTPIDVARRCVRDIAGHLVAHLRSDPALFGSAARWCVEPSAGGGAFVAAVREAFPAARIAAVDLDRDAPAVRGVAHIDSLTAPADLAIPGVDFAAMRDVHGLNVGVVIGNPPFDVAEEHVRAAIRIAGPNGMVAMLLPLSFRASRGRRDFWSEHPAAIVRVIPDRPSFTGNHHHAEAVRTSTGSRDYAWYVWGAGIPAEPGIGEVAP